MPREYIMRRVWVRQEARPLHINNQRRDQFVLHAGTER
jgi:hypothetical protein